MNYWDYRKNIKELIPRISLLSKNIENEYKQKEKGRKSNYKQFDLSKNKFEKMERLLDTEKINSFVEVSLRAQSCPMPLNIDVWDGLKCPFGCKYCYADYFKHSLYTSFFDNPKDLGMRHCDIDFSKKELDKLMIHRGEKASGENKELNAIRLNIPLRFGIRFEDFPPIERKKGISYELLKYLSGIDYPVMINTKSDIIGKGEYVKILSENKSGAAVHITMISSNSRFLYKIEPGAPTFESRIEAARFLSEAGIRVIARIEPWMLFVNDSKDEVDEYIEKIKSAGITHLTFDSYSYSAKSKGISQNFKNIGIDFQRMFLLSSDSQAVSSFMLGEFIKYFQSKGLNCSTFDQGNVPNNDDWICCSVGDWFKDSGYNWGSGVIAIKFIQDRKKPTTWSDFVNFVNGKGGFLNTSLMNEVKSVWNCDSDSAWHLYWGQGIIACGSDEDGIIYKYDPSYDIRKNIIKELL